MQRRLILAALLAAAMACHGKPKPGEAAGAGGGRGQSVTGRLTSGVAPVLVADSAGIRHYLETVDTVAGATFDVTWNPNTVRLTRDGSSPRGSA